MKKDITYTLIVELFSQGNIILLDEENNIISPLKRKQWSDRDISAKREYIFPPENGINPQDIQILHSDNDDWSCLCGIHTSTCIWTGLGELGLQGSFTFSNLMSLRIPYFNSCRYGISHYISNTKWCFN